MSDERHDLRRELDELRRQLGDAKQALQALARTDDDLTGETGAPLLRAARDELRNREKLLRAMFDGSLDAMLLTNGTQCVDANAAASELFGRPQRELVGRDSREYLVFSSDGSTPAKTRKRVRGRAAVLRPDGQRREVDCVTTRNILPGVHLSVLRDVTEQKRAEKALRRSEEQLRHAQKMEAIGALAGGVAHDFNNSLSVILSYTMSLLDSNVDDATRADLQDIKTAANRAAEMARQLLAFSRRQVLAPRVLDLNQVLAGLERMLRRLVGERIRLSMLTLASLGKIVADPTQIEQVLMNLAVNARDAMPDGGMLSIETTNVEVDAIAAAEHRGMNVGKYVVLTVTDSGVGMDEATRARAFEPFFTTKTDGQGTGLGLATVFGIVQQSGGLIAISSEVGEGTTVKIYFPRTDRAVAPATPVPAAPIALGAHEGETVLLVEDSDPVRNVIASVLRRKGYTVLEAQNGGEALLVCEKHRRDIHLLVADLVMPGISGPDLAKRLAAIKPKMKVVYMSGYADEMPAYRSSGAAFLAKPITPEPLLRAIRAMLDVPSREK